MQHQKQLIEVGVVAAILSVCKSTVWDYCNRYPDFPKPIKLSAKVTRWKLSDLNDYIEARAAVTH